MTVNNFTNLSISIEVKEQLQREWQKQRVEDMTFTRWVTNTLSLALEKHKFITKMYPHFEVVGRLAEVTELNDKKNKEYITITFGKNPRCSKHGAKNCECMMFAFFSNYLTKN